MGDLDASLGLRQNTAMNPHSRIGGRISDENDSAAHICSADERDRCALGFGAEYGREWYTGPPFFGQLWFLCSRFRRPRCHGPRLFRLRFLWRRFLQFRSWSLHRSAEPFYLLFAGRGCRWHYRGAECLISIGTSGAARAGHVNNATAAPVKLALAAATVGVSVCRKLVYSRIWQSMMWWLDKLRFLYFCM